MKRFEKKAFKAAVKDNVKTLYRKTIDEATPQQLFQAVSYAVKDVIIDDWIETQKRYDETGRQDSILYVNGVPYGTCTWQQPHQYDSI